MHLSNTYFFCHHFIHKPRSVFASTIKLSFNYLLCRKLAFVTKYIYRQKCVSKYEPREYDHFPGQPLSLSLCSGLTLDVLGDRRERG